MINKNLKKTFYNKSILVTGATGSIGSEIVKKLLKLNCKVVRAMSNDENGMYFLGNSIAGEAHRNIKNAMLKKKIRFLIGDIKDFERNLEATKNIDIVIHAAAMKHVSICEYNPGETFKTNVEGTKKLVEACIANKVQLFLFISTDKAVTPSNVMGKSKLLAEKFVLNCNKKKNQTIFSVIRFGNIIGSRGSVLPFFINQIKNNKNITVTDKRATRFFITINKAINKIFEAISIMRGSEIFIIKSMLSIKIIDLAKSLSIIFKFTKKIKIIGLSRGEKLHETLATNSELKYSSIYKDLIIIKKKDNSNKLNKVNSVKSLLNSGLSYQLSINEIIKFIRNKLALKL
jgi:FlaA1/EpsC-like NDP-sugar epimerase